MQNRPAYSVFEAGRRVEIHKKRKGSRLDIVRQFFRILKKLRFGTTVAEIARDESMSIRTAYRWLQMASELFGELYKTADGPGRTWKYRLSRERITERI